MLPSYTVENYLKAIFQAQSGLGRGELVPMGQLAAALRVVPGTATTMVKTLAESGLVKYEPYAGVRLTAAGEKLAAMVLRRHRLIELFLVKVMGMSWTEVHDEAEQLEHAVSERLIDRIDEMLGRPATDPHGDPIPDSHGSFVRRQYDTLLTCPMGARVTVSRVTDQDSAFLHFVERHDLKPGSVVEVEERDEAADSVRLRGKGNRHITIGTRAASKVLVQAAGAMLLCLLFASGALAQTPPKPPAAGNAPVSAEPFQIMDNSFFVEEAFNQEAGIFQNIFGALRIGGAWGIGFTQEWPVFSQKHQLSYSLYAGGFDGDSGMGDTLINYRYQLLMEGPGRPAFSPRVSLILPTGNQARGFGDGGLGFQVNLPFSKQRGDVQFHWNGGFSHIPGVDGNPLNNPTLLPVDDVTLTSPFLAGSVIWRTRPMFHLMVESVVDWAEVLTGTGVTARETSFTLSPGFRSGWNIGDHQAIVGAALPVTRGGGETDAGVFFYFSYELPFKR
jgi:DtxR family Mn-dependent transcriptional regulator